MGVRGEEHRPWIQSREEEMVLRHDPEKVFRGEAMVSFEVTTNHEAQLEFDYLVAEEFGAFLKVIHNLSPLERDLLICYFVLGQPQVSIGLHLFDGRPQDRVSKFIEVALLRLAGKRKLPLRLFKPSLAEVTYIVDPPCLGEFRVNVTDTSKVMGRRNSIRNAKVDDIEYDPNS